MKTNTKHKEIHRSQTKKTGMTNRDKLYHLLLKIKNSQTKFTKIRH